MIFNDLALFAAVAKRLSFTDAAAQMGMPLSRASRRIAGLERHFGVKLFERTTRQVRLTEEGRRLLDRCQEPMEALQDIAGFADDTHRHRIRITAPPLAVRTTIGPRLLDFAAAHPDIAIDLTTTNTMLDFLRDNVDLAFRLGPMSDSSLVARRLWSVPYCFCAGQGFIKQHNLENTLLVSQLTALPAIVSRQRWLLERGTVIRPETIAHELDDLELVAQAAKRDMGIAMLPQDMVMPPLHPLRIAGAKPLARNMFVVYPGRRLLPARIRKLIEFMAGK